MDRYLVVVLDCFAQEVDDLTEELLHLDVDVATRRLESVWHAAESLSELPHRGAVAREDEGCPYEVRQLLVDRYRLLYSIQEEPQRVYLLALRHGRAQLRWLPDLIGG
ncbi:MAG: type II toxin-antitoxin system RelE/ParE family toxin [Myxococcales bacterium]|nr:type II toxin-antitoxin system RelE/ParE family toxin [Myxococcales bacterium]